MAMRIVFSFFGIVVSAAFLAVGLLMAFWPATYLRWARWSVENCAPWLVRGWDVNHSQYRWGFRMVGIWLALFGITAAVLCIWIPWFQ
jgi:hypothetical protein